MIKIELIPTYEKWRTPQTQLKKIEEEQQEVIKADNWEDKARELLDLAQTAVGLRHIIGEEITNFEIWDEDNVIYSDKDINFRVGMIKHRLRLYGWDKFLTTYKYKLSYYLFQLTLTSLEYFYQVIKEHDHGDEKYRSELLNRFLQEHQSKLESRRKEWANAAAE